ncbi:aromatic ring-hydroxylating dioxygenase subunit alpha [Pseudomonas sp. AN3A02]|jgi:phenylpropionate dioxygenase-like ring-hydroxylating dioxygenase large terminal subunit|uniref:aromatic ring-hydroxylating oxygenase subunit alpha n=1 Tax=Pseudomonas sp. AN3A02 TaxID=2719587 RepID=UPI00142F8D26|nr:aromatic ring-hydroxylating dioxygenase subunit alpha [Pseudomonas sp. AN3A02]NIL14954.1 aromatic ring-hydroxylating dioxygenase subunit alpha [Pseudomonas sp. AN3A02]
MSQVNGWWPVALSHELRNAPLARQLFGLPLVLFRDEDGDVAALPDRCPHRFAPLSAGKVRDGQIECPYHGWRFAADGRCTRVPGTKLATCSKPLLDSLHSCEADGLVWVSLGPERPQTPPTAPAPQQQDLDTFWMTDQVQCSLQDAAENFLDGFHTHFVHAGWIRHDRQRQKLSVRVRALADGVEAVYSDEGKQSGLISRWFEGERGVSMGRFRLPGLAEIEYRDARGGLNLLVSAWMTPDGDGQVRLFARVATTRGVLPALLKQLVLRRLFQVILRQDRQILERVSANQLRFHTTPATPMDGPQDLLGPSIRQLLEHGQPLVFAERELEIWL